jgi:hypothetical protein
MSIAIYDAIFNYDIDKVKKLIDLFKNNNEKINQGLLYSSWWGYHKIVKLFIKAGANLNYKHENKTALSFASKLGSEYLTIPNLFIASREKVVKLLHKVIILVPMLSKRFRKINHDILRESINYLF